MKKKILIDGYFFPKPRGMGRYVQELVAAISKNNVGDFDILVCIPKNIEGKLLNKFPEVQFIKCPNLPFPLWEQVLVPIIASKYKIDIVHSPYNTKSLLLDVIGIKNITTIHDLMFFDKEHKVGSNYQRIGNFYRKFIVNRFAKNKNKQNVVTVSQQSADEIQEVLLLNSKVVYTPVDFFFSNISKEYKDIIQKPYIYHVGGTSPHKNTENVIKAFQKSKLNNFSLVISGAPKDCELEKKYADENIIFTGWISDDTIASLYANSNMVVFPSLKEGYGLPIIEAFKFKKPLITSNIKPMSEIAGEAAYLINPYSINEITEAFITLNQEDKIIKQLENAASERANQINAVYMSQQMYEIYEEIL
ncbi:glycosyltransferase family 4 protein [Bacillus cereus]|uniref:glycosyltransferase family 4 protein n=1 Tax=Bacillus cereus TaxID=1396 RepID=UPI0005DD3E4D|nr:glycosyltransferase family 1 protein [Bacillus cereus]MDF9485540.1 glycosyltransferase family 1 protein [Bacillus cereus]COE41034.1 glycosyltransferase [Streptococcus pneumoniae]